ncbi:MAG: ABC transporter transmembrane domain-containing protein [Phycisphaerales bacterium]
MRFFNRTKLGRIISRMTSDAEAIRAGVQDVLFVSIVQFGQMFFAAVIMLYYDWVLFLVVLVMAPGAADDQQLFPASLGHIGVTCRASAV